LSGFFSKDEILAAVYEQAGEGKAARFYQLLYVAGTVTALLTAFYTFRAFLLTFHGEERIPHEAGDHAHESPLSMTGPLAILAAGSAVLGLVFWWTHGLGHFLAQTPSLAYVAQQAAAHGPAHGGEGGVHWNVMITSSVVALAGIALAWVLYPGRPKLVESLTRLADAFALYRLSYGKLFFDQAYTILIVLPLRGIAWLCYWFDQAVIDGLVDAVGMLPKAVGAMLRPAQGGMVQSYAMAMVLGLLGLMGLLVLIGAVLL
jgi:NADH-quinone oxidoreductase subunit L